MAYGIEYFALFDVFPLGVIAIIQLIIFVFFFTYLGIREVKENAGELAVNITIASFIVIFLGALFNLNSLLVGFLGVITWALASKHYLKTSYKEWLPSFFALWAMLLIFAYIGDTMRWALVLFAAFFSFIASEYRKRKSKPEPKKEEKKK